MALAKGALSREVAEGVYGGRKAFNALLRLRAACGVKHADVPSACWLKARNQEVQGACAERAGG